jgi:hypothetical protein
MAKGSVRKKGKKWYYRRRKALKYQGFWKDCIFNWNYNYSRTVAWLVRQFFAFLIDSFLLAHSFLHILATHHNNTKTATWCPTT